MSHPLRTRYPYLELSRVTTLPIAERPNLVTLEDFARPAAPGNGMGAFLDGLPLTRHRTNAAGSLTEVVASIRGARAAGRGITWALGPHVVKYGLSLLIIDLMERGLVTAVATNGAGAIHDAEIALFGVTSEEMTGEIQTGRFGMARETGEFVNGAARLAKDAGLGFGEALGQRLIDAGAPNLRYSLLASAHRLGIPMTVHVAIGTDIVHQHPNFDGSATGAATQHDFQILAAAIDRIAGGGVHLNIASSVVLPEVFLKCLTVANNLRAGAGGEPVADFLTVNIDHQSEYRPLMNVVRRPTVGVGRGVELVARVELMVPLLAGLLVAGEAR
jgi:hypothetical protein